MEFEDKLRAQFAKADATIAEERLNHHEVIGRAKTLRSRRMTAVALAACIAGGGVFFVGDALRSDATRPIEPVGPSPERSQEGALVNPLKPPPPPAEGEGCSAAADAHLVDSMPDLPGPVREMREDIIYAAWACDFDRLEELAHQGETRFVAVVGGGASVQENTADLSEYWRELDASGEPHFAVTKLLVRLLETEPIVVDDGSRTYVWPRAVITRDPADYPDLEKAYEASVVREMRRDLGYSGYRIQIAPDGDWTGFLLEPGEAAVSDVASFTPGATGDECSGAREAHTGYEQPDLPNAVNEVRRDIITRTWTCDYEGLEEIALHPEESTFMFSQSNRDSDYEGPADYWRQREEAGEPVLAALVDALEEEPTLFEHARGEPAMSSSGKVDIYIWTTNGYRVEISSEGDWTVFVPAG